MYEYIYSLETGFQSVIQLSTLTFIIKLLTSDPELLNTSLLTAKWLKVQSAVAQWPNSGVQEAKSGPRSGQLCLSANHFSVAS